MNITIVAGARPNFMKIAPIIKAIKVLQYEDTDIHYRLIHTGQHYDKTMSDSFFEQLGIPEPNNNLEAGGGTQAEQTASIMIKFEKELTNNKPDVVLVVGDVTSTMACTVTAKKLGVDVVHVEAGIRSGDMDMPEEINRIITDSICDEYFTTSILASRNLKKQNIPEEKIHFVGNTMIDTLYQNLLHLKKPACWSQYNLKANKYLVLTLHRPSNVDSAEKLQSLLSTISGYSAEIPIIFPVHPRTKKTLDNISFNKEKIILIEPQAYLEFMFLIKYAKGIVTDSGGITEEATVLNIPCITLRNSTERPETVMEGTNELAGDDLNKLQSLIIKIIKGEWKNGSIPALWDGHTAERIVEILAKKYTKVIEHVAA